MNGSLIAALVLMSLVAGFLGGYIFHGAQSPRPPIAQFAVPQAQPSSSVAVPPELLSFLSGWNCPCGDCEDRLLECDCGMPRGATEVKQFVVDLHSEKVPLSEIREQVIERYGRSVIGGGF